MNLFVKTLERVRNFKFVSDLSALDRLYPVAIWDRRSLVCS